MFLTFYAFESYGANNFFVFELAYEKIDIKALRNETRLVIGPENILFAGVCGYQFQAQRFDRLGSARVKKLPLRIFQHH